MVRKGSPVRVRKRALEEDAATFRRSAVGLVVVSPAPRVPSGYHFIADGLPRLADDIDRRPPAGRVELLKEAAVDVQAGARLVAGFRRDLEDVQPLEDQKAGEAAPQVAGDRVGRKADRDRRGPEDALAPVVPVAG